MGRAKTTRARGRGAASDELRAQRQYVKQMEKTGFDYSLVIGETFVRGIRDLGYRNTATAIDELVDNSIQAGAKAIQILFGYSKSSIAKPSTITVLDDGHGMEPEMIRLAVSWGGTHRENNRVGFGRYGYGLPSACMSQGRRFTVASSVPSGSAWHVTLDLDDISAGKHTKKGQVHVPRAKRDTGNPVLRSILELGFLTHGHGTAVVLDRLDRLTWKTTKRIREHLIHHFGVTYRNFLDRISISVDGSDVAPIDPLFLREAGLFFDLDDDRATELPPIEFDVPDNAGTGGHVRARFAQMPPSFARVPEDKYKERGRVNSRMPILRDHTGIIVMRNGRQIDVIRTGCPWTTFLNNDRYWGVELDFPAALDEEIQITTSKQQISLSERIWDLLKTHGVFDRITEMRTSYGREVARLRINSPEDLDGRASEIAMESLARVRARRPDLEERRKRTEELLRRQLGKVPTVGTENVEALDAIRPFLDQTDSPAYKVIHQPFHGPEFFRVEQIDGNVVLFLNTSHRFFTDVYAGSDSTQRLQASLEVLLFALGETEVRATAGRKKFYERERVTWSELVTRALERLARIEQQSTSSLSGQPGDDIVEVGKG